MKSHGNYFIHSHYHIPYIYFLHQAHNAHKLFSRIEFPIGVIQFYSPYEGVRKNSRKKNIAVIKDVKRSIVNNCNDEGRKSTLFLFVSTFFFTKQHTNIQTNIQKVKKIVTERNCIVSLFLFHFLYIFFYFGSS